MFLLIQMVDQFFIAEINIYIPLCFYLYRIYLTAPRGYCPFTFHYVSTYTYRPDHRDSNIMIYIPLCFYLYSNPAFRYGLQSSFTFHYVSTYTRIFSSFNLYYFPLSKLSTSRFAPSLSPPFFIYVLLSVIFLQKYGLCRLPVF